MDTLQLLRQVPSFATLNDDDLALLETRVKRVRYEPGAIACQQGDIGTVLYCIDTGEIQVEHVDARGKQRVLEVKRAGECFGETALLLGEPYKTTFRAKVETELLTLHREDFTQLVDSASDLRARLLSGLPAQVKQEFQRYHFTWLLPGEVVIVFEHKHWWSFVTQIPRALAMIGTVLFIAILTLAMNLGMLATIIVWALALGITSLVIAVLTVDWRNDYYIVTNRRVMHLETVLMVRHDRQEAPIDKVQNVEIKQPTLFQKIIGVSDVLVKTASVYSTITFATVMHGQAIKEKIFEQIQRTQAQHSFEERRKLQQEIKAEFDRATKPAIIRPVAPLKPNQAQRPRRSWRQIFTEIFATRLVRDGTITWRKHYIALVLQAWKPVLLGTILFLIGLLGLLGWLPLPLELIVLDELLVLVTILWFIWEFVDWQNDLYMLTKDRLIDLERNPLGVIDHSIDAPLGAVQNVQVKQPNIILVFLGVGEVLIETAGAVNQLNFQWMSPPREVANEILLAVENVKDRQRQLQRSQERYNMLQWLGAYHGYLENEKYFPKHDSPSTGSANPDTKSDKPDAGTSG